MKLNKREKTLCDKDCVLFFAGGLWSVFTLGGAGSRAGIDQEHDPLPLSNQSLLLLLVLANLTDGPEWPNPYRQAITCFRNTQGNICALDKQGVCDTACENQIRRTYQEKKQISLFIFLFSMNL